MFQCSAQLRKFWSCQRIRRGRPPFWIKRQRPKEGMVSGYRVRELSSPLPKEATSCSIPPIHVCSNKIIKSAPSNLFGGSGAGYSPIHSNPIIPSVTRAVFLVFTQPVRRSNKGKGKEHSRVPRNQYPPPFRLPRAMGGGNGCMADPHCIYCCPERKRFPFLETLTQPNNNVWTCTVQQCRWAQCLRKMGRK